MRISTLIVLGLGAWLLASCGAGLPPEKKSAPLPAATGCASAGPALNFTITNDPGTIYWAADARIDPADPNVQSEVKLLFEIPSGQLPTGITSAQIRVQPVSSIFLPLGGNVDTAFQISAIDPADLTGFTGNGQTPLTLTLRFDPVACEIPADTEANLVLGRLDASGFWQEVCEDPVTIGTAFSEVSCIDGDLSFGIFGVIPRAGGTVQDPTPPVFPPNSVSLTLRDRCDTCPVPSVTLEWGPASDGDGSGVLGYWIYVDGVRNTFSSDTTANPTVVFTLQSNGADLDTTKQHLYQVQAVDNAGNASTLFGALRTP